MKIEKIKLVDIVNDKIENELIKLLKGGVLTPACNTRVCNGNILENYISFCTNGDGICYFGIN